MDTTAMAQGFGMSAGLIIAIGAQNAFVLSQAVKREHHYCVAGLCSLFDILLIGLGVAGAGALVAANPVLTSWAAWGGALFVFWYGLGSLRSAIKGGSLEAKGNEALTLKRALLITTGVTLLNPHAYLDTLVLLGSVSGTFEGMGRWFFGIGAVLASITWFFLLAVGGAKLAPIFKRPIAWRVLDSCIWVIMWSIAGMLVYGELA